jgi:hypothetical protein
MARRGVRSKANLPYLLVIGVFSKVQYIFLRVARHRLAEKNWRPPSPEEAFEGQGPQRSEATGLKRSEHGPRTGVLDLAPEAGIDCRSE